MLPEARAAWLAALDDGWSDPRRLHREGGTARMLLDGAREAVAELLGVRADEVSFPPDHARTAAAAVLGCALPGAGHVVVSAVEHSAVLHAASWPGPGTGRRRVVEVAVGSEGVVDTSAFVAALTGAGLACLQHGNGEIGTLQPLAPVHAAAAAAGVPLVVDAAASLGQVPLPSAFDVLLGAPRSWGSVPGVGLLVVRRAVRWRAHEPGESSASRPAGEVPGEVDVPAALAAAVSLRTVLAERGGDGAITGSGDADRRHELVSQVRRAAAGIRDVQVHGPAEHRLPHVVTFSVLYLPGDELVRRLDAAGFAVASGSACTADTLRPSHVLAAVGGLSHGNVRLVLPREVSSAAVGRFCSTLPRVVEDLRRELGVVDL